MKYKSDVLVIGLGKMGSVLYNRLSTTMLGQNIVGLSRNTPHYDDFINQSNIVFICTKQVEAINLLKKYSKNIKNKTIVSLVACLNFETIRKAGQIEESGLIVRIMGDAGMKKIAWTYQGSKNKYKAVEDILSNLTNSITFLGREKESQIDKEILYACEPGWIAHFLSSEVKALHKVGNSKKKSLSLVDEKLSLVIKMRKSGKTYEDIVDHIATPGGVTQAGILVSDKDLSQVIQRRLSTAKKKLNDLTNYYQLSVDTVITN